MMHTCLFYSDQAQLRETLVPYFVDGLLGNEKCLWVTAPPLEVAQATEALAQALPATGRYLESGQLQIIDGPQWYSQQRAQPLDAQGVLAAWLEQEKLALAAGYRGLRITGNPSFLSAEDWPAFMAYECAVSQAFEGRRITALCTYSRRQCAATEVFEVVRAHRGWVQRPPALKPEIPA